MDDHKLAMASLNREKILETLQSLEDSFKEARRKLISLLDAEFRPTIVEVKFDKNTCMVELFHKEDNDNFILDTTDREKLLDQTLEIVNKKEDFLSKEGGKLYKYRYKYGSGLNKYYRTRRY